ncbi:MAG: EamA family transporter [Rhodospirillales bacterium]
MTSTPAAPAPATPVSSGMAMNLSLLVLLATLWGASYSFIKVGVETIPPITLIAGRTAIAGVVLLGIMAVLKVRMPRDRASWRSFMVQACLNSVFPFTVIAWAEQTVDASLATILNSTSPIFIFLFALGLSLEGERTWRKFLGVAFGFAGIVLIIGADALQGLTRELLSQLAIVAATVCYAGAAVFGRRFSGMHAMVPAAGSMIAGGAVLIPVSLVVDRPWTLSVSMDSALALLGLSVLSTAVAFVIYFRLLKVLGSVGTAAQAYLRVPIGVALGALVLGETLPLSAWAGMACVIAGVAAMTAPNRRTKRWAEHSG